MLQESRVCRLFPLPHSLQQHAQAAGISVTHGVSLVHVARRLLDGTVHHLEPALEMCTSIASHDNRPLKSLPEKNRRGARNSWSKSLDGPLIRREGESRERVFQ